MDKKIAPKIAIVHDYLIKLGGAEKVLEVIHQIFPDAPIYTLLYDKKGTRGVFDGKNYQIIPSKLQKKYDLFLKKQKFFLSSFPKAVEEFDLSEFDIVISSTNSFAHGVITKPKTFHLSYCFSPTRYLWDWHHEYLAENNLGSGLFGLLTRKLLSNLRVWDRSAAKRTDQWIAISNTVAERIKKYYRVDAKVIYSPANIECIKPTGRKPENFYIIVSRLSPYKKVGLAVEAFNKNSKKLVIVGEGSEFAKLKNLAKANIQFLGYLSDQKVASLMSEAKALIFPGEEDFGLTPIESMAAGRPVVAYKKGGVTETVIEGKTGVFFDRSTPESLSEAIDILEKTYETFSPESCRSQAEKFSIAAFKKEFKTAVEDGYKKYIEAMDKL